MNVIQFFLNLLSDPRGAIAGWIISLGAVWVYTPLFFIVFIETGLVFFPFLPGDSLLFAAGVFSADGGGLNIWATLIVFYVAAILGNTSNYWIGPLLRRAHYRFWQNQGAHARAHGQARSLFREIRRPYHRHYAFHAILPHVCAVHRGHLGHMNFGKFTLFNAIGGISWVSLFVLVGYFFGGIPFVQNHFEVIVLGIVAVSVAPAFIGAVKAAMSSRKGDKTKNAKHAK